MRVNRKQLFREIRKKGWSIDVDNIDFRKKDATLWRGFDSDNPILRISKGKHFIELIAVGDVRIRGRREKTYFKYDDDTGEEKGNLTPYLRKFGEWENNNWFEVNSDGSSYEEFEEPYYSLDSAVSDLLSRIKKAKP
jgi:hypothetical protein